MEWMIVDQDLDYPPDASALGAALRWSSYLNVERGLRDGGLSCRGAGEQQGAHVARPRPRRLSTYGLVFVSAGGGVYVDGRHPDGVAVRAPAVLWLFPGVMHDYGPGPGGWTEHWVLFEGTACRGFENLDAWSRQAPVARGAEGAFDAIAPVFSRLRRVLSSPDRRAQAVAATATGYLLGIAIDATAPSPRCAAASVVDTTLASASAPLSVAERAHELGMSTSAFRTAIRDVTGLSPHELVIRTRLAHAQQLLAKTTMEVAAIARQVGYDDPAYFSRLFRRRVGLPPRRFREQEAPRDASAAGHGRRRPGTQVVRPSSGLDPVRPSC
jgi:AraC-like DNA-binding protein